MKGREKNRKKVRRGGENRGHDPGRVSKKKSGRGLTYEQLPKRQGEKNWDGQTIGLRNAID